MGSMAGFGAQVSFYGYVYICNGEGITKPMLGGLCLSSLHSKCNVFLL